MKSKQTHWLKLFLYIFAFLYIFLPKNSYAMSGFDFPLGKPDGVGYAVKNTGGLDFLERFDYQGDGIAEYHPGEDWNEAKNGKDHGADNDDYNDPIYAIADGVISYASFPAPGWGNLVMLEHEINGEKYWSQYAHMTKLADGIRAGEQIKKGDTIGYVGAFPYGSGRNVHLHFEIRKKYRQAIDFVYNWSKEKVQEYYICPTEFINSHRPVQGSTLSLSSSEPNAIDLAWTKSEDPQFLRYEIYRATAKDGTGDENQRTLVYKSEDQNILTFRDEKNISGGQTYYYRIYTYFKSGLVAQSEEVSIELKREIIKISDGNSSTQRLPVIDGDRIFWEDLRSENGQVPRKLFFYDMKAKKVDYVNIGIDGAQSPRSPGTNGGRVVFSTGDGKGTGSNIYCYDFNTGNTFPITQAPKEQLTPTISKEGIVVWSDMRNGTDLDLYWLDVKKPDGEQPFVAQGGNQRNPRIWGNKVVWMDSRVGNRHDLYLKELGSTTETLLATNVGYGPPDIWENWATWSNNGKLSLVDTNTKVVKVIQTKGASTPRVKDGKVVYSLSEGNGISYIHAYDIATGGDTKIDFPLYYDSAPAISGNMIVFDAAEKDKPQDYDIYMTYL